MGVVDRTELFLLDVGHSRRGSDDTVEDREASMSPSPSTEVCTTCARVSVP